MDQNNEYILLAKVTSSHGIKGEFVLVLYNSESTTIEKNSTLFIKKLNSNEFLEYQVEQVRYGNKAILKLVGVNSRNDSDAMIPFEIYVSREDLPELEDDEFYIDDLLNFDVIDESSNQKIGEFVDYYDTPASTVMTVKTPGKKIDVIFNKNFVKEVDIENRKIYILVPEEIE